MKKIIFNILYLILCFLVLYNFNKINSSLPFYFAYDMDSSTAQDLLAIQSNMLPNHINHPGFGLYFLINLTHDFFYKFDFISIFNFEDLRISLEPILLYAEFVDFVRIHTVYLASFIVIILSLSFYILFNKNIFYAILTLLVFAIDPGINQQVYLVRSEIYSLFYYSLAFLFTSLIIKNNKDHFYFLGIGILLGLMYLSKVQSLLFLLTYPILLKILFFNEKKYQYKKNYFLYCLHFFLLISFFLLLKVADEKQIPEEFATFSSNYRINSLAILFSFLFTILFFLHFIKKFRFLNMISFFINIQTTQYIFLGFFLSFILTFTILPDVNLDFDYLIYLFKMLFFRNESPFLEGWKVRYFLKFYSPIIQIHIAIFILLIMIYIFKKKNIILLFLIEISLHFHILISDRTFTRDYIWYFTLVNLLTLIFIYLIHTSFINQKYLSNLLSIILIFLSILVNKKQEAKVHNNVVYEYSIDQSRIEYIYLGVYGFVKANFDNIIKSNYSDLQEKKKLAIKASRWKEIKTKLSLYFTTTDIKLNCVSFPRLNHRVWFRIEESRIEYLPENMKFYLFIDPSCLFQNTESLSNSSYIYSNEWVKNNLFTSEHSFDTYLLLSEKENFAQLDTSSWKKEKEIIKIKQKDKIINYFIFKSLKQEFRAYTFKEKVFFAITDEPI